MNSQVSLGSLMIGTAIGFMAGFTAAVTRQWWRDWRDTVRKVPVLRRGFFSSLWDVSRVVVLVLVVLFLVGRWAYRDATDKGPTPLIPPSSASPSVTR